MPSLFMKVRAPPTKSDDGLDAILLSWTPDDHLTVRDLVAGGCIDMGRPGSGQTSSSSREMLQACVNHPGSGGLILAASPSDLPMVQAMFKGKEDRLVIFDENAGLAFNALDFMLASGASTKDIATAIDAIDETVGRSTTQIRGKSDDGFFTMGAKRMIENAVVVGKHANGRVTTAAMQTFINSTASTQEEFGSPVFQASEHNQTLKTGYLAQKTAVEEFDYALALEYFSSELPRMAYKTVPAYYPRS